jgi:electron transport complex protein RnfG
MEDMKKMLGIAIPLILICVLSGAMLAFVHEVTEPRIKAVEAAKINASLSYVFPGGEFTLKDGYYVVTVGGEEVGYAFIAEGNGFSSVIRTMVGMKKDGTIARIYVISQLETPGLGTRVAEPEFIAQFQGHHLEELRLSREGGVIDGITGATISSRAMTDSIREKGLEVLNESVY